jgi:uncharacterized protein YcgI (DUF1989 family)
MIKAQDDLMSSVTLDGQTTRHQVPARKGAAGSARKGQKIKVINTHGQQVVDMWVFAAGDPGEYMSMAHTHTQLAKIIPMPGDLLYSNRRWPILKMIEDTSGNAHDTLIAACDQRRYDLLGHTAPHDNCADNFRSALRSIGIAPPETPPPPLNLFLNTPVGADGQFPYLPPRSTPNSYVVFEALKDVVVIFSACPQDLVPLNGADCEPTEAHFMVYD